MNINCHMRLVHKQNVFTWHFGHQYSMNLYLLGCNSKQERLASETAEDRTARLQYYSDRHRELQVVQSQLPLFEQRSVRTKMSSFHDHLASLDSPQCTTCSERFPGLWLCSSSTECIRCSHDKHSPKVYSAANNMDPGPIPPQL